MHKIKLTVMIFVVLLSGCRFVNWESSGTDDEDSNPGASIQSLSLPPKIHEDEYIDIDPSGQTILFWHLYTEGRQSALREIADLFNAENH